MYCFALSSPSMLCTTHSQHQLWCIIYIHWCKKSLMYHSASSTVSLVVHNNALSCMTVHSNVLFRPQLPFCIVWCIPNAGHDASVVTSVISMMLKSISSPLGTSCDQAISGVISPNLYHLTSRHFLCFSVFSVHSVYDTSCSTLVLVPLLHRYLSAVCTAPAFIPPVCSSGYYTFCLLPSSPPLLIQFHLHMYIYKLIDTLL